MRVEEGCSWGWWNAGGRDGWEAADASNDNWVEVEEMRLHKQEGIQVMRKVAGKLGNESRGRKE